MVSVQDILIDAISPILESVPYSLKISSKSPVAADDENIFTIVSGTSSPGNLKNFVNLPMNSARKSRNPDALRIPTAVINPTSVGIIFMTVKNPLRAPLINVL